MTRRADAHDAESHRAVAEARMDEWMRRTNLTPRDPFTATRAQIAALDTTEDR